MGDTTRSDPLRVAVRELAAAIARLEDAVCRLEERPRGDGRSVPTIDDRIALLERDVELAREAARTSGRDHPSAGRSG